MTKTNKKKFNSKSFIGMFFVYASLIIFALWILMPFSLVLLTSFKGIIEANSLDFHWLPEKFTVQGYEKAGLVAPSERNKYGYLLYNEIEQERIKKIKLYQQFGFKLKEIKDLIDAPEYVVKEAVERQVGKLKSEITRLSTLIDRAEGLIEEFIK